MQPASPLKSQEGRKPSKRPAVPSTIERRSGLAAYLQNKTRNAWYSSTHAYGVEHSPFTQRMSGVRIPQHPPSNQIVTCEFPLRSICTERRTERSAMDIDARVRLLVDSRPWASEARGVASFQRPGICRPKWVSCAAVNSVSDGLPVALWAQQ